MSGKGPRKRELAGGIDQLLPPVKRNRKRERKFKLRKLQEVLDEIVGRVANSDGQLVNSLVRELNTEHVRVIGDAEFEKSCEKLLRACLTAKLDSISTIIFDCLAAIFTRGRLRRKRKIMLSLKNYQDGLARATREVWRFKKRARNLEIDDEDITIVDAFFRRPNLDRGILGIYVSCLREQVITADEVPEKIKLIARRSMGATSLSSTARRITAVEFHVAMATATPLNQDWADQMSDCESILAILNLDRDFRVRRAVAEGFLELSSVWKLSKKVYFVAKEFLKDTDSDVRIAAIRLLIGFANNMGHEMILKKKGESGVGDAQTTISDDAFSAICDAMNDIEIAVRVEAAQTLGDFQMVSEDLIYQTLDKKMMRTAANKQVVKVEQSLFALSKKASANKDRRWKFAKKAPKPAETRGGWSRGKELNAVAPGEEEKKNEEEEEESIIPHGACGAFVSALEDEFMDVRKAAVYSLGRLACNRPAFAVSALEYLADMFNDEIADVRLDAINALTPLVAHGQLNSEQLNVISKCLDDAMPEARQAMRELLKRAQFVDVNCVEMCVKALLACLKRFPKDKEQIYGCMADIGNNHSVQVQAIMRSLLDIHLIFHTREPSIDDQEYVGKLIMVLNAAASQPSLVMFMPEFVHRHYRFLRNSYPNIVRAIRVIDEEKQIGRVRKADDTTNDKAEEVVMITYQRLCEVSKNSKSNLNIAERNSQRDDIFRDAAAISHYNSSVSGAARLIFCLAEVSSTLDSVTNTVLCGGELTNVKQLITQSIEDMQSIEHRFSGVSVQIHAYLVYCKVYLSFLDLLVWMMQVMAPQADVVAAGQSICKEARRALEEYEDVPESAIFNFISACEAVFMPPIQIPLTAGGVIDDKRKIITPSTVVKLLDNSIPTLPLKFPEVDKIHVKYARITSPNKDTAVEETLKFFAHLPHGMPLEFELHNMREHELETIRIKTIYPDGRFDLMRPRVDEIRDEGRYYGVNTQLKITCSSPWSEAAEIDVVIGIWSSGKFVPVFSSPSCFSPAHIRVRIHPHSR
ncbi:Protein CBG19769 [Caenorhabditis briggsae]|uniref:Integrator complex subunit 4/Protein SIEL C-terminal Ig-like domain-containing protein n=4 Tax=Caenorhabditis briggsae TaxID=6238 RepID=A0AAE9J1F8_CAEBR|nr:Protein CBG19769 [Caenorhabditis briggsae]ULU14342.1 hypothetical protein L3Y34_016693 [Caenorhabditis briggsae]UMM15294.1 hypothetical protein L5515_002774 [Caenorhabditis briggsae]CAP36948.1 Protein CBG19769 [Caenorhabditis briggsae]